MDPKTGRCAILFPHGVLFRNEEAEMRRKLVESDLVECVLGLGPGLFYNSPMEACVVICRSQEAEARKGKILFIDAVAEVARERAQSFLRPNTRSASSRPTRPSRTSPASPPSSRRRARQGRQPVHPALREEAQAGGRAGAGDHAAGAWAAFDEDGREFWTQMDALVDMLDGVVAEEVNDA
jgi:type I restriction enzyme M protein